MPWAPPHPLWPGHGSAPGLPPAAAPVPSTWQPSRGLEPALPSSAEAGTPGGLAAPSRLSNGLPGAAPLIPEAGRGAARVWTGCRAPRGTQLRSPRRSARERTSAWLPSLPSVTCHSCPRPASCTNHLHWNPRLSGCLWDVRKFGLGRGVSGRIQNERAHETQVRGPASRQRWTDRRWC